MLLENISQYLLDFTGKIESKGFVSAESAAKIRKYIRSEESPVRWELFLILGGLLGAISISAGVFAIISHNWYDYPKHLKGVFSIVPALVGIFFYYRMLFFHKDSKVWVEASSLFLMLMIGASISLVAQTYQMDGDFYKFIKVWLFLTIPLFYLARASGIAFFYLLFALLLFSDFSRVVIGYRAVEAADEVNYWFWFFFIAFLPHLYLSFNTKSKIQGVRATYLVLLTYFVLGLALVFSVDSNYILWALVYQVGVYLLSKRYMSGSFWFFHRPLEWLTAIGVCITLLGLSNETVFSFAFAFDSFFNAEYWEAGEWYYFILLLVVGAGVYFNYFKFKEKFGEVNLLIVFAPLFIIFMIVIDEYTTSWWWITLPMNLYILFIGIVTMVNGSEEGKFLKMLGGLLLIAILIYIRYFDNDLSFISKGLLFIIFGGMFFLINMFVKEKVEQIERHKRRLDEE